MKIFFACICSVLLASSVHAEGQDGKDTIYRSRSGGSASADVLVQKKQATTQKDEMKARPSMDFVEKNDGKKTRTVYLARSGGSAGTQTVEVPAQK